MARRRRCQVGSAVRSFGVQLCRMAAAAGADEPLEGVAVLQQLARRKTKRTGRRPPSHPLICMIYRSST